MERGYIKIWRKILDSFLATNPNAVALWIHLILLANHKDAEFMWNGKRQIVKRGQFITGRRKLSKITGIHQSTVHRLLETFKIEHLIEQQKTNKFRLITIINYGKYQNNEPQTEQQLNNKRTTTEQQVNTNKNNKNNKNDKNDKNNTRERECFAPPALEEIKTFWESGGLRGDPEEFFNHFSSNGWKIGGRAKMKDWQAAARNWSKREKDFRPKEAKNDAIDRAIAEVKSML